MKDTDMRAYAQGLLELALERGCSGAEVCITAEDDFSVGVLGGEVEDYSVSSGFAVGLRVQLGGRNGYACTESTDDAGRLVGMAMDNAASVQSPDEHPMAGSAEYADLPAVPDALEGLGLKERIELAMQLEQETLKLDERVKRVAFCRVASSKGSFSLYNTNGLAACKRRGASCCYVEAVMEQAGEVRDGFAFRANGEAGDTAACAAEAVEEAAAKLGAAPVPPGTYRILLRNDAAAGLVAAFCGMFSADAVQKGLSPLAGLEGQRIAGPLVTLLDDPLNSVNPIPFDDEGVPSVRTEVIKEGVLNSLLHNLKTAKKAGVSSTGNAGRGSAGSPVGVRPTNYYIQPGSDSYAQLLQKLGTGLLITDFSGMHAGVNCVSGQFSLSCRGRLIEDGKDVRAVNEITMSGSFTGLLSAVEAVGSDLRFSMPGAGCFASPSLLVSGAAIAGDA